jgi:hypothetical protein
MLTTVKLRIGVLEKQKDLTKSKVRPIMRQLIVKDLGSKTVIDTAKAKDLTPKAKTKTKDFIKTYCPLGQGRGLVDFITGIALQILRRLILKNCLPDMWVLAPRYQ